MLSLGVLSWRAHETLVKTLASYRDLLPLVDEAVVFFNEISDEDRAIAGKFGFRAEGSPENLGILGGTLGLVRCLGGDIVMSLQNDNPVNVPPDVLAVRLDEARQLITAGRADMVRLRDRFDPTFSDRGKYLAYWPGPDARDTLLLRLRRLLRPFKARRMAARAPAVFDDPAAVHPDIFMRCGGAFVAGSRSVDYSDQPFLAPRSLALELLEWADAHKARSRTLNGMPVPEIVINGRYWRGRNLRIAVTDGIFAHARFDDSFRKGNAAYNPDAALS